MTPTDIDLLAAGVTTAALGLRALSALRSAGEEEHAEDNTYGLPEGEPISAELRHWLAMQEAAVLAAIPEAGPLPDTFPDLTAADWLDPMATAMTPLVGAYWDQSGKETYERLGRDPDEWRVTNPHLRDQIRRQSFAFCRSTNASTNLQLGTALRRLRLSLTQGIVEEGEALPKLTDRVKSIFTGLSDSKAAMIAATEASRAVHAAQVTADEESGVVAGLELLLSSDACPLCRKVATECKQVRLGDAFAVIGHNPDYSSIKHPPIHPSCQCTAIEVLKPEYGGPADPKWGTTLEQPQKGLTDGYKPPEGKHVPKPEPDRPKPTVPSPKTIGDRLAAYTEGDRKLAAIAAFGDEVDRLKAEADQLGRNARDLVGQLSEDEWKESNLEAAPKREAVFEADRKHHAAVDALNAARARAGEAVLKLLEVPAADRADWKTTKDSLHDSKKKEAADVQATLARIVKAPGRTVEVGWEKLPPGRKGRAVHHGEEIPPAARTSTVGIGPNTSRQTIAHELGHAVEWQVPGVHERVQEFVAHRVGSETPQAMAKLFPKGGYKPDEMGRKDRFDRYFNAESAYYVGKVINHANSEVISMGVQALFENPRKFAAADPEYAKFVLGVLDGSIR